MDNLRGVIKNLFCYIAPQQILEGDAFYKNIDEETFVELGSSYIRKYSNDELRNMYHYMQQEFEWQNLKLNGKDPRKENGRLNAFDSLLTFNESILIEENGEPLCGYIHLLRWREMITSLEEDLFVTSFLAKRDTLRGKSRTHFFWKPVIGQNNYALNKMLKQGVAENHFHLKGSAPMFHLTWINMMNYPEKKEFEDILNEYEKNPLRRSMAYGRYAGECSYVTMWRQAALIRCFLFAFLNDDYLMPQDAMCTVKELQQFCPMEKISELNAFIQENHLPMNKKIRMKDIELGMIDKLGEKQANEIKRKIGEGWVVQLLRDPQQLGTEAVRIKQNIKRLGERYDRSGQKYDYALCKKVTVKNPNHGVNEVICGERWFMYAMFMYIYTNSGCENERYVNWFYAYLVIKSHIRMEIIQANMNVGFDNFLLYQNRKEEFIDNTELEPVYLKMAVRDTIYNQSILSLEARISPKNTVEELRNAIRKYDNGVCMELTQEQAEELKKRYFYVVHFIKEKDKEWKDSKWATCCRHMEKRNEVKKQALAIAALREQGGTEAERIKGIDASSPEIVCRPEVFAQAFRYLKNHTPKEKYFNAEVNTTNLMVTYHVGEDFLDIIDGMRAIDEALCFFNLRCGDRLGHALALGVDVDEWYQGKTRRILISKQAYLDNLVWLYAKIRKYGITDAIDTQTYIEKRFDEYFQEVYLDNIVTEEYDIIMKKAKDYFNARGIEHGYRHTNAQMGINEYYNAWKLRGDSPELYANGFFCVGAYNVDEWEAYAVNKAFPLNYSIRYNPAVAFLYYTYHYNERVRRIGEEVVEIKINPCIIRAAKEVQMRLQKEVSDMGLGIETNPSSNYLIGSFRRYDRHPIVKWYNNGLTYNQELLEKCPQIRVCVNTDDQGVFATYIENEYAYLALALEKYEDEEGNRVYNRTLILQWLDNIRKMGINMSFGET